MKRSRWIRWLAVAAGVGLAGCGAAAPVDHAPHAAAPVPFQWTQDSSGGTLLETDAGTAVLTLTGVRSTVDEHTASRGAPEAATDASFYDTWPPDSSEPALLWATPRNANTPELLDMTLTTPHYNATSATVSFTAAAPAIAAGEGQYEAMWAQDVTAVAAYRAGTNPQAIATTEAQYQEMWARDVSAMTAFTSAAVFMGSPPSAGSSLKLRAQAGSSTGAEFRILQGGTLIARLGVQPNQQLLFPTDPLYVVDARSVSSTTAMPDARLVDAGTVANVSEHAGLYAIDSEATANTATGLDASGGFQSYNHTATPIDLTVTGVGDAYSVSDVVKPAGTATVPGDQRWTVYALVNGVATPPATLTNPNATVTVTANNSDDAFTLAVS